MFRFLSVFGLTLLFTAAFVTVDAPVRFVSDYSVAEAQQKKKRGFFERLFSKKKRTKKNTRNSKQYSRDKLRSKAKRKLVKQAAKTAALPKVENAARVIVIGDQMAETLAEGLKTAYRRTPNIEFDTKIERELTLANESFYPWIDRSDFLFLGERVRAVVVVSGNNDRRSANRNGRDHEFGSEAWENTYSTHLLDFSARIQALGVPVIWVQPLPMISIEESQKAQRIGRVQQTVAESLGFEYVDLWGGFTTAEGLFHRYGVSVTGASAQLRMRDGIAFTRAGLVKYAFYVQQKIDLILEDILNPDTKIESGTVKKQDRQRVIVLSQPQLREGAILSGELDRTTIFYRDSVARDFFVSGKTKSPPFGRADYFAVPESSDKTASVESTEAEGQVLAR